MSYNKPSLQYKCNIIDSFLYIIHHDECKLDEYPFQSKYSRDDVDVISEKIKNMENIDDEISSEIQNKPWLRPVYDDPKFLIRMIWRRYGGWWDGEYDRLLPDSRENEAQEWVELSGGIDAIINKALDNLTNKKYELAAHLIEVAYYADKRNEKLHEARKKIYAALSEEQDSSMARNIFNHANLASNELKRDLASED